MSMNLRECLNILKAIAKIKNARIRKEVLKNFEGEECIYNAIREIALNTRNGNIKMTQAQRKKLLPHKKFIKGCSEKAKTKSKRKRLVVQSGGFLPYLIPIALSLISTLKNEF